VTLNEAQTRALQIDPQLRAAAWKLNDRAQVRLEVPVDGYDAEPWNGVTDYCLYDASGNVLAVVEAKRCSRNAREADEQLRHYVTEIAKKQPFTPFGFMANGHDISFWEVGLANPRLIAGFFAPPDLERLKFLRQNQRPLEATPINGSIVDRSYQHEAIRRLAEAFAANKRRALLVMATGTGKTRVAMALIDVFLRANQAQNVLFLADRDALVDQTLTDGFKAHLPHEPRDRIYTHQIDKTKRLFVATEQTLALCYAKFSPGFFDLIIFDEAHRSLFKRFTEVIEYFDARMIGLTATPATFIDRDTYRLFGCDANVPTFLYDYPQAVKERFLVDFTLYQAHTSFQRKGIKGVDLSEEDRNALAEQGIDPDSLDYAGTEIEVEVSNRDTLRKQWEEVMETCLKDQSGQLPGKTIVFAMTKKHAHRLAEVFEEMYPQHVGVAQVITSTTERVRDGSYGDGLITKFKKNNLPRIAISVDMLDTGIDAPEVVNLVFMKPVQSRIKLWQMIGRGTRNQQACKYLDRLPDGKKTEFKIIDFWQNDFNKKADDKPPIDMPSTRVGVQHATQDPRTSPSRPYRRSLSPGDHGPSRHDGPRPARFVPGEEGVVASCAGVGRRLLGAHHAGKTGLPPSPRCAASPIRRRCRRGRRNLHPQGGAAEASNHPGHAVAAVAPVDCGRREPAPRHRRARPFLVQCCTRSLR
jgi:type I restriction enzyme R subunit